MWSTIYDVYSAIKKLQHYRKVSVLVQPSNLGTRKLDPVRLAVVTSVSSEPVALPNYRRFPPSTTSISRSPFANSRALAKRLSSVVFLVRFSRQFGLTGRKAAWRSELISSRYKGIQCPGTPTSYGSEGPLMASTMEAATPLWKVVLFHHLKQSEVYNKS